jgi:hypothetical protein
MCRRRGVPPRSRPHRTVEQRTGCAASSRLVGEHVAVEHRARARAVVAGVPAPGTRPGTRSAGAATARRHRPAARTTPSACRAPRKHPPPSLCPMSRTLPAARPVVAVQGTSAGSCPQVTGRRCMAGAGFGTLDRVSTRYRSPSAPRATPCGVRAGGVVAFLGIPLRRSSVGTPLPRAGAGAAVVRELRTRVAHGRRHRCGIPATLQTLLPNHHPRRRVPNLRIVDPTDARGLPAQYGSTGCLRQQLGAVP